MIFYEVSASGGYFFCERCMITIAIIARAIRTVTIITMIEPMHFSPVND